jgi:GMP synthase (glutamine-hydrolysing)
LVLRHEPFEHLGYFSAILDRNAVPYEYHDLGQPITLDGYRRIIIMGGPMSANDPLPGLTAELAVIKQALKEGAPLLGICLGAQLIAKALGASVYRNAQKEIGWGPIHFTEAGQADPLFREMERAETFFHWHGDTFDLPQGAEWLAYSEKCRHQAYRYGNSVYGLQFHPEVTAEMIADWCAQPLNCGDVEDLERPIDPKARDLESAAAQILEAWLARE